MIQNSHRMYMLKQKLKHPKWWSKKIINLVIYLLLFDLAFVFLYPFIYMLITSIKSPSDLIDMSIKWIPTEIHLENYKFAFDNLKYVNSFLNSLGVTLAATAGHLFGCSFIAYGFARFKFPLKKILMPILILSIIVPIQTIMVPIYLIYSNIGFVGSPLYLGIILPTLVGNGLKGGLFVFIFYSYFQNLPKSLEEAAYVDGCNSFKTFVRIVIPATVSAFLICGVLSVVWHWGDFYEPSLYITDSERFLLPQMLPQIYNMQESLQNASSMELMKLREKYNDAVLMAATALTIFPVLLAYIFVQNRFMESVASTGMKE